ncbi:MarR family winged helix-turn-helix transcriptional regulator [Streptomyces triticirhizae]|nr:MarR family transcriptional regulator [Streptomyces triticirhizae]
MTRQENQGETVATGEGPRWLSPEEDRAWRGWRRMRLLLTARISADLAADSGLSDPDYDVLSKLSEAGGELRVTELAGSMLWSQSRISHHLVRMARRGLVTRDSCAEDRRGTVARLTDEGRAAIERAAPDHVASVRRHLIDRLTPAQLAALAEIAEAVTEPLLADGREEAPADDNG